MKMPNKTLLHVNVNLLTSLGWHCTVVHCISKYGQFVSYDELL